MTPSRSHFVCAPLPGKPVFEKAGGVLGPLYSVDAGLRQHLSAVWNGALQNAQAATTRAELSRWIDCTSELDWETGAGRAMRERWV
jgi:hypothetical protein